MKKYDAALDLFMEIYEIPTHAIPSGQKVKRYINSFFSSKYGMFTCYDHYRKWGDYDYNAGLIEFWEKPN